MTFFIYKKKSFIIFSNDTADRHVHQNEVMDYIETTANQIN